MARLSKKDADALVQENNEYEERALRLIDDLEDTDGIDQHWLDIGREKIELAFMALNRAVRSPDRISLPEDSE
jgi:hypothetical protein